MVSKYDQVENLLVFDVCTSLGDELGNKISQKHLGQDFPLKFWRKSFGFQTPRCVQNAHTSREKRFSKRFCRLQRKLHACLQFDLVRTFSHAICHVTLLHLIFSIRATRVKFMLNMNHEQLWGLPSVDIIGYS